LEHTILRTTQQLALNTSLTTLARGNKYDMKSKKLQTIQQITKTFHVKPAYLKGILHHAIEKSIPVTVR